MPKIIIMNQGTEHTRGYDPTRLEPLRKSVARCTWLAEPEDIIISPVALEQGFLSSIGDTLGFDASSLTVMVHERLRNEALVLSDSELRLLRTRIASAASGPWLITPCFWTPDVAEFASELSLGDAAAVAFASQRGTELFNRKRNFRQLAAGASLPIPDGSIVTSASELERAIRLHLPRTGTVIVKKDNAAGGIGNVTLTTGPVIALPGSRETRYVNDATSVATSVWNELTDELGQVLVVEVYHQVTHSFYFEYFIGDEGRPQFLHSGDVRFRRADAPDATELVWVGLDTPTSLPHFSLSNALTLSGRFAALAADMGCRGHINIDAIVTTEGELLFNESNVRWGGGTSMHAMGRRLLGARFADEYAVSFVRDLAAPPRPTTAQLVQSSGLGFSPNSRQGIIVLACSEHESGTMECLIIASSRERVHALESSLRERLAVAGRVGSEPLAMYASAAGEFGAAQDEHWVITGASSGIGYGLTSRLAGLGKQLTACVQHDHELAALRDLPLARSDAFRAFAFDVRDEAQVRAAAHASDQPVDVLVACAGVFRASDSSDELDFAEALDLFSVNALGPLRTVSAFLRRLKRGRRPRLVVLSSILGSMSTVGSSHLAYRTSKAALNKLVQGLAAELKVHSIVVVALEPGWVRTAIGGSRAPLSVGDSVSGIIRTVSALTLRDTGRFLDYQNQDVPW